MPSNWIKIWNFEVQRWSSNLLFTTYIKFTFRSGATSSTGLNVWCRCFSESLHTKHTGWLSSRQKSLSFSPCTSQSTSDDDCDEPLFCKNDSHTFRSARFVGVWHPANLFLQTGHSWNPLELQNSSKQALQTLWLHNRSTGSVKISQHTGHSRSSSDIWLRQLIFYCSLSGYA